MALELYCRLALSYSFLSVLLNQGAIVTSRVVNYCMLYFLHVARTSPGIISFGSVRGGGGEAANQTLSPNSTTGWEDHVANPAPLLLQ